MKPRSLIHLALAVALVPGCGGKGDAPTGGAPGAAPASTPSARKRAIVPLAERPVAAADPRDEAFRAWAALGVGVAVTGALGAACVAITGALAFVRRRPPWSAQLPLGLALGFVALTAAFWLTRPRAGLPPATPASGLVLALTGGVAATAAMTLSLVARARAPRRAPHRPEGATR